MRFVRIYHAPNGDPGSRIRVDYDPDDTGAFCISDEDVLPERTMDPNCKRVDAVANIEIDAEIARWLRDAFTDLCAHLEAEGHK